MHLAETHGAGRLMPPPGDPRRQRYWQWHFYLMSTFQPEVLIQFHPEKYFPGDADAQDALRQASRPWIDRIWRVLDDAIGEGPYILGELYTTCDISFAMQALWRENQPPDLPRYPNARRCLRRGSSSAPPPDGCCNATSASTWPCCESGRPMPSRRSIVTGAKHPSARPGRDAAPQSKG